MVPRHTESG